MARRKKTLDDGSSSSDEESNHEEDWEGENPDLVEEARLFRGK